MCKKGEEENLAVEQNLWKRRVSYTQLTCNGMMSLNRDSCIQIGCMPVQKNTIDCGVFVCIVSVDFTPSEIWLL